MHKEKFGAHRQRPVRRHGMLGGAVIASMLMAAQAGATSTMSAIDVNITGTPETRFNARWEIVDPHGNHRVVEEGGSVPASRHFEGAALEAGITLLNEGRLQVEVQKGSNRTRSATSGEGSRLKLNVR